MCNGMIESISKAFLAHTSATKRSLLLLLVLTVVSTGQGSGKGQNLCLHTHTVQSVMNYVCILLTFLFSADETLSNQLCHDTDQISKCPRVLTMKGCIAHNQLPLHIDFNICQFIPADLSSVIVQPKENSPIAFFSVYFTNELYDLTIY